MKVGLQKLWYKMPAKQVLEFFATSELAGITDAEAIARQKKFGYNNPDFINPKTWQFYKYRVLRSGKYKKVAIDKLALGDILHLTAGDIVPAEVRLIKVNKLQVNEEPIEGSLPISHKNTFASKVLLEPGVRQNMLNCGTGIISGSGWGVVVGFEHKSYKVNSKNNLRNQIVLNTDIKPRLFKQVDTIIFDDLHQDWEVSKSVQKFYIGMGISCVYFMNSYTYHRAAKMLPEAENLTNGPNKNLKYCGVYFALNPQTKDKLKIIKELQQNKHTIIYIYRGEQYELATKLANLNLVVLPHSNQLAMFNADVLMNEPSLNKLTSILYNKK